MGLWAGQISQNACTVTACRCSEDAWRPMESAPKDGTLVRLWVEPDADDPCRIETPTTGEAYSKVVFGRFGKEVVGWWDQARLEGYRAIDPCQPDYVGWQGFGPSKYHPTHWRPRAIRPASVDERPEGQDPQGLGAQHASAVPEGRTPNLSRPIPDTLNAGGCE